MFEELTRNVRIADLFDIGVISVCIYSAIVWFRRTTSRSVVIGVLLLTIVYFLARTFDLTMTSLLFQTVFAVLLVALVVVFQEEIRRAFERVAIWGSFRDRRRFAILPGIDALLEGISTLASNPTGALLVIRGQEPLDRHVEGGIPLYGRFSKPLLYSIFDPHSPGHDGAMLIEGDRVSKFGAHLPLSKNLAEIGTLGTRHAAALGMSECSDAFVIAVSEERGTIAVAENGRLKTVQSVAELKDRMERFYTERFRPVAESGRRRPFKQNARIKLLSLLLACVGWYLFAYRSETIQRTFIVPIEHRNLPEGWYLEGPKPLEATVTLSGSSRAFGLLNPGSLILSLDLAKIREGPQQVWVTEEQLKKPANLSVYRIDPNALTLEAHPTEVVPVPVEPQTTGTLPPTLRLTRLKVFPETVRVRLLQSSGGLERIPTDPVDLSQISQTTLLRTRLALPEHVRLAEGNSLDVQVTVEVAAEPSAP